MNFRPLTPRALAALLVLVTIVAYIPAIDAGYVWDDDTLLTANPQMRSADGLLQIWSGEHVRDYTPLTLTSFWIEWHLWGKTPTGYHVVNILLHALSAVLIWGIMARLSIPGAWLAALLFAIHPVNVASVAWIAERKNTLSGTFFFASILCFLVAREKNARPQYLASILLFILAALSKGAVVTLPAVLLLCILWKDRKATARDFAQLLPFALIAIGTALLTVQFQARAQHYNLIPDTLDYRLARAGASIWHYLASLAWPAGLSPMRPPWLANLHSPLAWLPACAAVAVPAVLYAKRRTWGRPLLFAYAYYVLMLLPVLGFVWMTLMQQTPGADWWQYLAAPGIFACAAAGATAGCHKWRPTILLCAIIVAALLAQTWRRAAIYDSMQTYCAAVAAEDPYSWTIENNLGITLKRQRHFAAAEACYRQALKDNPYFVEAHINLANALDASGDPSAAEAEYRAAARLRPNDPFILDDLAGFLYRHGRQREAAAVEYDAAKLRMALRAAASSPSAK